MQNNQVCDTYALIHIFVVYQSRCLSNTRRGYTRDDKERIAWFSLCRRPLATFIMIFIKLKYTIKWRNEPPFYLCVIRTHGCMHVTAPEYVIMSTWIKGGNKRSRTRVNEFYKRAGKYLRHGESRRQTTGSYVCTIIFPQEK